MFQKILRRIKRKFVLAVFRYYFGSFVYNFDDIDIARRKLSQPQQMRYYEEISAWVQSTAFGLEMDHWVRSLYRELATTTKTEENFAAYRLVLIVIRNYEKRLLFIAEEYKQMQLGRKKIATLK